LNYNPNPAKEKLFITNIPTDVSSIALVDITGKTISNFTLKSNQLELNINDLSQGVYLLMIKDNNGNVIATDKFNKIK
jgi:hypothetical protein